VWQPGAFTGESALVASRTLETWKDWLVLHLIEDYATVLPKAFVDERFAFFDKAIAGTREQRSRQWRGVALITGPYDETASYFLPGRGVLGDAVGQLYAQRYFSPETKARVKAMVANIIAAYRRRIEALPWMDPATKAEAQSKLTTLYVGIGYPEIWRDYSAYEVKADDIFGNLWRGSLFEYHRSVAISVIRLTAKSGCGVFIRRPSARSNCPSKTHSTFPQHISSPRTSTRGIQTP
jgi:putative endopeptidase